MEEQLWVKASKTWTFSFAISETLLGKILLKKHAPAWILLDLSKESSFHYDLVLRASESPLYPPSLDLAPELKMVFLADGESQGKTVFPPQSCVFSTTGTKGKRPRLSSEEQEHHLHVFLKLPRKSTFFSSHSFSRANLSCSMVGLLLRVWLG